MKAMANPAATVIVPIGSVDYELDEQLVALAHQDVTRSWELVLSLNTADDDERVKLDEMVSRFGDLAGPDGPAVVVVDSSSVRSASHARNVAADAGRSPCLLFCDGDDIADKGWVRTMLEGLDEAEAVGGHLDEELLAVSGQERWRPPATPGGNPTFLGHPYLVSANMGVSASLFEEIGGFDESLIRGEDIALSWELLRRGTLLHFVPDAVVHYRHRRGLRPMIRQHFLYGRGMSQVLARHGVPDDGPSKLFRANGQAVDRTGPIHVLRRGSLALGRLVGLAEEAVRTVRSPYPGNEG